MEVFAASVRALVKPVTMRTSIASQQESMVAHSRSVSGMLAASTETPSRIFSSCASAREPLASSARSCSLMPQAAPISSVGSSERRVCDVAGHRHSPDRRFVGPG